MQVPSEEKRRLIATTATKMFASRPFHKVRLEDIASAAGVGKGTLYVYFPSKEDLYFSLVYDGFADVVDRLSTQLGSQADSTSSPQADSTGSPLAVSTSSPQADSTSSPQADSTGSPLAISAPSTAADSLRLAVHELVGFAFQHPQLWELMRTVGPGKGKSTARWDRKRLELTDLLSNIIRRGVKCGEFADSHPELTALYIPGIVRSVMLFGPKGLEAQTVTSHILRILQKGLTL